MATFAMSGHSAESKEKRWLSNVQVLFPSIADNWKNVETIKSNVHHCDKKHNLYLKLEEKNST